MNLVFKFGEHYYEAGDGGTFLSVLLTFLGAFLGLLTALWVDRTVQKRENKKKLKEKVHNKYNQLRYFRDTIESVLFFIPKQTDQYVDFSKDLKAKPLEIVTPKIRATFDLLRLRDADTKDNQESFFEFFEKNDDNIKLYRNSISYADFLYRIFNSSESNITRAIDFKHKDQLVVRDCIEEASILLGLRMKVLEEQGNQTESEFIFLNDISDKYGAIIKGFMVFADVQNDFVYPLFTQSLTLIKDEDVAMKVFILCRKANARLNAIKANSSDVAKEYETFENQTNDAVKHLTEIRNKMDGISKP